MTSRAQLIDWARAHLDALPEAALPDAVEWLHDMALYHRQIAATVEPPVDDIPIRAGEGNTPYREDWP